MKSKWKHLLIILGLVAFFGLNFNGTCATDADKASENVSKDAEQFKVNRKIVGVNGITDKVEFEVIGRCSYENPPGQIELICKEKDKDKDGPALFKKHTIFLADNIFVISTQLQGINVSVYRSKIILKPQNIIPDLDLVTGEQDDGPAPPTTTTP